VRLRVIDRRSLRDDAERIEPCDRPVIDDVIARLHRLGDARQLIELAHVAGKVGVIGDAFLVASEQREVGDIEPDQGGKQPPVRLGDLPAEQVALS
jgi:hypothetical protein